MTLTRRVRLHERIAEALEEIYGADTEVHASELAHHFAEAQTSTGPSKLVHYSTVAGQRALAAYAYEDALTHFERGLVARDITLSGTVAASDEEAATLLFGLARAQMATTERHEMLQAADPRTPPPGSKHRSDNAPLLADPGPERIQGPSWLTFLGNVHPAEPPNRKPEK